MKSVIKSKDLFISIVLCCYNDYKFIKSSIESVLKQTYKKYELIIVDDGSNDKTKNIINKIKKKDDRIRIISNDYNIGLTKSLNIGIKHAKYDWIARIDSDDLWDEKKLLKQVYFINKINNLVIIASDWCKINEFGQVLDKNFSNIHTLEEKIMKNISTLSHSTVIFNKHKAIEAGLYRERLDSCQDLDFWQRLLNLGELKYLNILLAKIRIHKNQITQVKRSKQLLNSLIIFNSNIFRKKFKIDLIDDLDDHVFNDVLTAIDQYLKSINYYNLRINFEKNKLENLYIKKYRIKFILGLKLIINNFYYVFPFIINKMNFQHQIVKKIIKVLKKHNVI